MRVLEEIDEWCQDEFGITGIPEDFYKQKADRILRQARSYSCSSRGILASNNKVYEKAEKIKLASRSDTSKFAQLLLYNRRKMKHRGLKLIEPGSTEWYQLKEVSKLATEFCNEFGIEVKEGYQNYISIGLPMMKNFSLYKFKTLHSSICNIYEAQQEIEKDKSPGETKRAHDIYMDTIKEKIGYAEGYTEVPEKYKYFIQVVGECRKFSVSLRVYISAQFESFDWRSGIPDPAQLVGSKAIQRLQAYAYAHGVQLKGRTKKITFKRIRK